MSEGIVALNIGLLSALGLFLAARKGTDGGDRAGGAECWSDLLDIMSSVPTPAAAAAAESLAPDAVKALLDMRCLISPSALEAVMATYMLPSYQAVTSNCQALVSTWTQMTPWTSLEVRKVLQEDSPVQALHGQKGLFAKQRLTSDDVFYYLGIWCEPQDTTLRTSLRFLDEHARDAYVARQPVAVLHDRFRSDLDDPATTPAVAHDVRERLMDIASGAPMTNLQTKKGIQIGWEFASFALAAFVRYKINEYATDATLLDSSVITLSSYAYDDYMSYANEASTGLGESANVKVGYEGNVHKVPVVTVRPKRDIEPGEQILSNYGPSYWRCMRVSSWDLEHACIYMHKVWGDLVGFDARIAQLHTDRVLDPWPKMSWTPSPTSSVSGGAVDDGPELLRLMAQDRPPVDPDVALKRLHPDTHHDAHVDHLLRHTGCLATRKAKQVLVDRLSKAAGKDGMLVSKGHDGLRTFLRIAGAAQPNAWALNGIFCTREDLSHERLSRWVLTEMGDDHHSARLRELLPPSLKKRMVKDLTGPGRPNELLLAVLGTVDLDGEQIMDIGYMHPYGINIAHWMCVRYLLKHAAYVINRASIKVTTNASSRDSEVFLCTMHSDKVGSPVLFEPDTSETPAVKGNVSLGNMTFPMVTVRCNKYERPNYVNDSEYNHRVQSDAEDCDLEKDLYGRIHQLLEKMQEKWEWEDAAENEQRDDGYDPGESDEVLVDDQDMKH